MVETHTALILLTGDRAYKLRKPIDLGFVDQRTRAARWAAAHREVELNRRFAPDVYLGVLDVLEPGGAANDHLVVMRRLPDDRRLSAIIRAGGSRASAAVQDVARALAVMQSRLVAVTGPTAAASASRDAVARHWRAVLAHAQRTAHTGDHLAALAAIEADAEAFLSGRFALFESRIASGRIRDGHGDLLADDVYVLDDGPRFLDCLDFSDELRIGDVLAEAAFLRMELERLHRPDLARHFMGWWEAFSGETRPHALEEHYVSYRATIRALVALIRSSQSGHADGQVDHLLRIAVDHGRRSRVRLVLVGGLPGTGKSTLANGLHLRLGWPVLRSDEVRRELTPASPAPGGFGEGRYATTVTATTYATMLDRARHALMKGESIILDASWSDPRWWHGASIVARATASQLVELRCSVGRDTAARRIEHRLRRGEDLSEATAAIADAMAAHASFSPTAHVVDTSGPAAAGLVRALEVIHGADPRQFQRDPELLSGA